MSEEKATGIYFQMLPARDQRISSLVALSERELRLFFPGDSRIRLFKTLPNAHSYDPLGADVNWFKLLETVKPQIVVSGWRTPALPKGAPLPLYLCHVAGTVRHVLSREMFDRDMLVTNWGSMMGETVAEGTLGMILAALRRTQYFGDMMHREKGWAEAPAGTYSLFDRKVAIYGFGSIARNLIPFLRAFRCEIRIFSHGVPDEHYREYGVGKAASLAELFGWSDVLVVAEASMPENRGIITEALLRQLRSGTLFVNIARGALVDESALARVAVTAGIIVALDVYEHEPLAADSPLRGLPNVTLMPHMAGVTTDRIAACGELAIQNLESYLTRGKMTNVVTGEIFDRST